MCEPPRMAARPDGEALVPDGAASVPKVTTGAQLILVENRSEPRLVNTKIVNLDGPMWGRHGGKPARASPQGGGGGAARGLVAGSAQGQDQGEPTQSVRPSQGIETPASTPGSAEVPIEEQVSVHITRKELLGVANIMGLIPGVRDVYDLLLHALRDLDEISNLAKSKPAQKAISETRALLLEFPEKLVQLLLGSTNMSEPNMLQLAAQIKMNITDLLDRSPRRENVRLKTELRAAEAQVERITHYLNVDVRPRVIELQQQVKAAKSDANDQKEQLLAAQSRNDELQQRLLSAESHTGNLQQQLTNAASVVATLHQQFVDAGAQVPGQGAGGGGGGGGVVTQQRLAQVTFWMKRIIQSNQAADDQLTAFNVMDAQEAMGAWLFQS
ncbi:hypothetical protein BDV95DRAFT_101206 [Massariosphaeria phaeospora]|uniref:Uncharacterized protein n=1 Tax=Massariosphaeria phaeospora TaxID=100035 RepID=A0A7C8M994_9PLEO|nr:hypothetical protein BDV95DRAFT_101206 [Massariosphaeria phaeospora]